jgi:2-polyprenyl-6-methoxyphenol hydroxylase-like FAD-dependent oxidoreductase
MSLRISCIGAGPAGLYFAILAKLRDPGNDVKVYERSAEGSAAGWGVTFTPDLVHQLHANDGESAREIEGAAFRWRDQFVCIRGEQVRYDGGVDICNLNRPQIVQILAARARALGVHVEYGTEIASRAQLPHADVIVASDGAGSRLREESEAFGTSTRVMQDKYIWLGTDKPFDAFAYHFTETSHGWIWASSYGVRSDLSTFVVHCGARTWASLGFDTMTTADSLTLVSDLFKEQLAGHRLMGQVSDESNAHWRSSRTVTNKRWQDGTMVLVGDSAHATHFSAGLGTTLAIEDAIALADNLGRHASVGKALQEYERQRTAEIRRHQAQARRSGRWFADISRCIDRNPDQFATLLHARRSALQPVLPPLAYYHLRQFRRRVAPVARAVIH